MNDELTFQKEEKEPFVFMKANEAATVAFGRSLRGYNADEVDDFLDDVAESLHRYAELVAEKNAEIEHLRTRLSEYDAVRESLEETVRLTREDANRAVENVNQQAGEFLEGARNQANTILAEAQRQADAALEAARENAMRIMHQTDNLRSQRDALLAQCRLMAGEFETAIKNLEATLSEKRS